MGAFNHLEWGDGRWDVVNNSFWHDYLAQRREKAGCGFFKKKKEGRRRGRGMDGGIEKDRIVRKKKKKKSA